MKLVNMFNKQGLLCWTSVQSEFETAKKKQVFLFADIATHLNIFINNFCNITLDQISDEELMYAVKKLPNKMSAGNIRFPVV